MIFFVVGDGIRIVFIFIIIIVFAFVHRFLQLERETEKLSHGFILEEEGSMRTISSNS